MEAFGEFQLEQRLDAGGEFAFFRARRAPDPYRGSATPCVVLRFSRVDAEQRWPPWADPGVARVLRHPTIVPMLDAGEVGDHRYFSFEYVDGVDLRHLLQGDPLPRNAALLVARTIVEALCVASEAVGLDGTRFVFLHGAIAPRWIFASRAGEVKLGGFGLGYLKPERPRGLHETISAPEQLSGSDGETAASDIFQVGLVLFRMLFASDFVSAALARILGHESGRPVGPTALPATDPPLDRLLRQLLAERPEERFASIHEVRAAVEAALPRGDAERDARAWLATRVERVLDSEE
jgi:eukaryotic-like serine/threonine-protein kinase